MNLVVVESPTKAKTLSKFLGKDYQVVASMGHVLDLPKSQLGVDVEHDFAAEYVPSTRSKPVIKDLKDKASQSSQVWLSTDPDREGEAIAWHIAQVLLPAKGKLKMDKGKGRTKNPSHLSTINSQLSTFKRAVFHEITESAVKEAFAHPRDLDMNLVNAQQARRVLDRLVGYKLSPLLWKKVRYGLSAGRVQSVAVRLVVERERERLSFKSEEYWSVEADFKTKTSATFKASLSEINGEKINLKNKESVDALLVSLKEGNYAVSSIEVSEKRRNPAAPFTTSSLQQGAGNRFGFSASRVMKAAQSLYEGGLITYMRTDSTNLSTQALSQIRDFIGQEYGASYLPEEARVFKTKSRLAQEAHEAIRPTSVGLRIKDSELAGDEAKVYELIWQRTVACQMKEALFELTSVLVHGIQGKNQSDFRASGSVLKFDGFLKALGESEEREAENQLPKLSQDESVTPAGFFPSQHFTEPPPRFTEATLIKSLEELGIGRPSTYAPTINTITARGYVSREGRALYPNEVGLVVNDLLVKHFPSIVDYDFTARMEGELDEIAEGKKEWVPLIREFYDPFEKLIEEKDKEIKKEDITTLEETDEICPECGKRLVVKLGKFGKFLSCTGFPECKYAKPIEQLTIDKGQGTKADGSEVVKIDESQLGKCPQDGGDLLVKQGRFGKFIACPNYPTCKFTKPYLEKIGMKCPQCSEGEVVFKKSGKGRTFFGCSRYPECKFASWTRPTEEKSASV